MVDPRADPIELVPSRFEAWRAAFEAERNRLRQAIDSSGLERQLERIEHVGSTAVDGLPAKDIVDVDVVVRDEAVPTVAAAIAAELGGDRHEASTGWHPVFRVHDGQRFNDHVFAVSRAGWKISVVARDVLRHRDDLRVEYAELKRDLAAEHDDLEAYSRAKSPFIDRLLDVARSDPQFDFGFDIPARE